SELKYGLSVTGIVHPDRIITNDGVNIGDYLILTKPLGTGIINTAIKGGIAKKDCINKIVNCMADLNKTASTIMQETIVNACTDITGFGLLGHACEMIQGCNAGIIFNISSIPFFPEAEEFAKMGMVPAGTYRNRNFRKHFIEAPSHTPPHLLDILFDPQTSGGLLISVPEKKADKLLDRLKREGIKDAAVIGEVVDRPEGKIILR
ncbi:MAG: selenide, water dikinase SelD, partial [Thermodesulfobacteriota bacterium]|nr:selenide, water dikinase SelD [Thermodesulfobacteriota bacterium]